MEENKRLVEKKIKKKGKQIIVVQCFLKLLQVFEGS